METKTDTYSNFIREYPNLLTIKNQEIADAIFVCYLNYTYGEDSLEAANNNFIVDVKSALSAYYLRFVLIAVSKSLLTDSKLNRHKQIKEMGSLATKIELTENIKLSSSSIVKYGYSRSFDLDELPQILKILNEGMSGYECFIQGFKSSYEKSRFDDNFLKVKDNGSIDFEWEVLFTDINFNPIVLKGGEDYGQFCLFFKKLV